jgi:sulfite exporter TauE/SafE
MCGPFVIMQVSNRLQSTPAMRMSEFTRLKGAALMPYHLGRLTTYIALGAIAGALGSLLTERWQPAAATFIFIAGIGMVLSALPFRFYRLNKIGLNQARDTFVTPLVIKCFSDQIGLLFRHPIGVRGFFLGVVLGFLPCGMVYAALGLAASTASFAKGAALMAVFGLATVPALLAVALMGTLAAQGLKNRLSFFARAATVLAGVWLCLAALRIYGL